MAKEKKRPVVHNRETADGYVHAFDQNGRPCWDCSASERVMLLHDLRVYGAGLHIGQLGWTVPEATDGYKAIDVLFDSGQTLTVRTYALARVDHAHAQTLSETLIAERRNTRFDADPIIADLKREEWIEREFAKHLSFADAHHSGTGDQEVYAFTYPSLREIAQLKGEDHYPVKIGYTGNGSTGALGRIRQQILEAAAYPERPLVLCQWRTWDGKDLEKQVHRTLRERGRKVAKSLGTEWYATSQVELIEILASCPQAPYPSGRIVVGADETLDEGFAGLMANGAKIEYSMDPESACVSIAVKYPDDLAG